MSNNNNNHTFAFITVAVLIIGAVGYAIYSKFMPTENAVPSVVIADSRSTPPNNPSKERYVSESDEEVSTTQKSTDVTGKVISVNTNAEKKTFIKLKSFTDQTQYTLLTSLSPDVVNINKGDIISFSNNLEKSNNNAYYFINKVTDYTIVDKNTDIETGVRTVAIADVNSSMEGSEVVLSGMVSDLFTSGKGHSFFELKDSGSSINAVLFNSENNQLEDRLALLNKYADTSKKVNVEGKIGVYKGDLQIIVAKVYN